MEYVKRAFGLGIFFYVIGFVAIPIPHAEVVSATAGGIGTTLLIGAAMAWWIIRIRAGRMPSRANAIRMLTFVALCVLFPFVAATLASSGETINGSFSGNGYNWQNWTAHLLSSVMIWGLYLISVELPLYLHRNIPRSEVSEQTLNLIPSWGSGLAAILTGLIILDQHFAHGPFAQISIMPVLISAVAVATLLLPFYKWIIIRVWISGIVDLFSFPHWKKTIVAVMADIDSIIDRHWFGNYKPGGFVEHLNECEGCRIHLEDCSACREAALIEKPTDRELPDENLRCCGALPAQKTPDRACYPCARAGPTEGLTHKVDHRRE